MSHQDAVFKIPKGFKHTASTDSSKYTAIESKNKKNLWYSVSPRGYTYLPRSKSYKKFSF